MVIMCASFSFAEWPPQVTATSRAPSISDLLTLHLLIITLKAESARGKQRRLRQSLHLEDPVEASSPLQKLALLWLRCPGRGDLHGAERLFDSERAERRECGVDNDDSCVKRGQRRHFFEPSSVCPVHAIPRRGQLPRSHRQRKVPYLRATRRQQLSACRRRGCLRAFAPGGNE